MASCNMLQYLRHFGIFWILLGQTRNKHPKQNPAQKLTFLLPVCARIRPKWYLDVAQQTKIVYRARLLGYITLTLPIDAYRCLQELWGVWFHSVAQASRLQAIGQHVMWHHLFPFLVRLEMNFPCWQRHRPLQVGRWKVSFTGSKDEWLIATSGHQPVSEETAANRHRDQRDINIIQLRPLHRTSEA